MDANATVRVTLEPPKPPSWALSTPSPTSAYSLIGYPSEGIIHIKGQPGAQTLRLEVIGIAPLAISNLSLALSLQCSSADPSAIFMPNGPFYQAYLWPFSTPSADLNPWCSSPTAPPANLAWQPEAGASILELSFTAGSEAWLCRFLFAVTYQTPHSTVVGIACFDPKIYNEGVPPA